MRFAVIRHPEAGVGTCPESALEHHRGNGWVRVSEWRAGPDLFHLPHFADAVEDLDAQADAEPVDEPAAQSTSDAKPEVPAKATRRRSA